MTRGPSLLWLWAVRDLMRSPGEGILAALALASLVWIVGATLLLTSAVEGTARRLVGAGPSLVIRHLGPQGLAPMPASSTASVAAVPGALRVRGRVWGPARAGDDPVEIVAVDETIKAALVQAGLPVPTDENVVAGPGFVSKRRAYIVLTGSAGLATLQVADVLEDGLGLVAQDTLLVSEPIARRVLGLRPGLVTDVVLDVNQESEEDAIRPDLQDALPFPVIIHARHEAIGAYAVALGRRGGLFLLLLLPAGLALLALVVGIARDRAGRAREVGLLKSVGWTTRDILALHGLRAVWVAVPAAAVGMAGAWLSVFSPWVRWPGALLFGWSGTPPALFLDTGGAGVVLLQVAAVVVLPWLVASLWPAVVASAKDPWDLIQEGS